LAARSHAMRPIHLGFALLIAAGCSDGTSAADLGMADAAPDLGISLCGDTRTDPTSCGSCGVVCATGAACVDGKCACPQAAPDVCASGCASLQYDTDNCGACGHVCPYGSACFTGICTCPPDFPQCGDVCANTRIDRNNCGACGNACPSTHACVRGA